MRTSLLLVVSLVAAGCNNQPIPLLSSQKTDAAEGVQAPQGPPPDRWETSTADKIKVGDVQVSVAQVAAETGRAENASVFAVRLSILNTTYGKRLHYQTWAQNATLRDNFGNPYAPIERPRGVGVRDMPLDPTTPVVDTLMFEMPIATAASVTLTLPGDNVGQNGVFRFQMNLVTSGARLGAVEKAAAAAEAEAKARAAEAAAKEAEARRVVEQRRLLELQAEKERQAAEAKKKADDDAAEKKRQAEEEVAKRQAAEKKRIDDWKAEIADLEKRLEAARAAKKKAEKTLIDLKDSTFATSVKKAQQDVERLTAEIADLEGRLAQKKKEN